jgi:uncharacterized protein YceK
MNRTSSAFLVCLACMVSGCSAISSRVVVGVSSPPPPLYFGGVRTDCKLIGSSRESDRPLFWQVYGVIDMPFSAGADILLVPYDVYTDCRYPEP